MQTKLSGSSTIHTTAGCTIYSSRLSAVLAPVPAVNSNSWCCGVTCSCAPTSSAATVLNHSNHSNKLVAHTPAIVTGATQSTRAAVCRSTQPNSSSSSSSSGESSSGRDHHVPASSSTGDGWAGGGGASSGGGNSSGGNGSGDGSTPGSPKFPAWYKVWLWATALTYLVWRWKWRRDRKLAAEEFEKEQQMQQQLDDDWQQFAQQYRQGKQQDERS